MVGYGAPVEQAIRLDGRQGRAGRAGDPRARLSARRARSASARPPRSTWSRTTPCSTARSRWRSSAAICHARGVPVIVDAASEYDLKGFLAAGADLAIYSAHKFLGGPTAGIVAGRKDLVRAAFLQNCGIGRGMKVGKESIVGAMAALEAWERRDHAAVRARERGYLELWLERLARPAGLAAADRSGPDGQPARSAAKSQVEPAGGRHHGLGAGRRARRRRSAGHRARPRGRARPLLSRPLQPAWGGRGGRGRAAPGRRSSSGRAPMEVPGRASTTSGPRGPSACSPGRTDLLPLPRSTPATLTPCHAAARLRHPCRRLRRDALTYHGPPAVKRRVTERRGRGERRNTSGRAALAPIHAMSGRPASDGRGPQQSGAQEESVGWTLRSTQVDDFSASFHEKSPVPAEA